MALEIRQLTRLQIIRYCEKLEKENKRLKEEKRELEYLWDINEELKEENKKLNEKYDWLWKIYTADVNERREENKKLKSTIEQMENTCKDYLNDRDILREENKILKNDIDKLRTDLHIYQFRYWVLTD